MITIIERIQNMLEKHGATHEQAITLVKDMTNEHLAKMNSLLLQFNDDDNIHELLAEASSETVAKGCKLRCTGIPERIGFQVSSEEKENFEMICEQSFTTPSAFLRKVVQQLILGYK